MQYSMYCCLNTLGATCCCLSSFFANRVSLSLVIRRFSCGLFSWDRLLRRYGGGFADPLHPATRSNALLLLSCSSGFIANRIGCVLCGPSRHTFKPVNRGHSGWMILTHLWSWGGFREPAFLLLSLIKEEGSGGGAYPGKFSTRWLPVATLGECFY